MRGHVCTFYLIALFCSLAFSKEPTIKPVTPNASPEARALLKLIYDISGKYCLTGQHNYPNIKDRNTQFATQYIGKTPAIFSTDMGHARAGDTDSYLARPDIVQESIRQHKMGSLVTICWHAVPPTAKEPVTFRQLPGAKPEHLASVQGQLLDKQFQDVLTPGTALYESWCTQVDSVAIYLKQLADARVPVLWRPYHEMNGSWFWWGGRRGQYSTIALYKQLFNRLVKHHKLNNLIWVWSVDRPNKPEMLFTNYYPGDKFLDIVSIDIYGRDFNKVYYDSLAVLSQGKPMVLGEVGQPPTLETLQSQPRWAFYVIWAGMVRNTPKREHKTLTHAANVVSLDDQAYAEVTRAYRLACGLPALMVKSLTAAESKPNFSGIWLFDEDAAVLDNMGVANLPAQMTIQQTDNDLLIKKSFILEYADDNVVEEKYTLDGQPVASTFWNSPRLTRAFWSADGDTLLIDSKITFARGQQKNELTSTEKWLLQDMDRTLAIQQLSDSMWGTRNIRLIYRRQ